MPPISISVFLHSGQDPDAARLCIAQPKKRAACVRAQARAFQPLRGELTESCQKAGGKEMGVAAIGIGALQVASVEVSRSTLPALAHQPNVVAVLPNQGLSQLSGSSLYWQRRSQSSSSKKIVVRLSTQMARRSALPTEISASPKPSTAAI